MQEQNKIIDEIKLKECDFQAINDLIVKVLKRYVDMKDEYYQIVSHWIIGTYMHDSFLTYPFLFFNATKSSGKTRLLKLIAELSRNGKLLVNISEAVLFRTAKNRTLCIDELEHITNRDKVILRELLNAAYKRGMCVERVVKVKGKKEEYIVESFDVYCAICMANIWGLDDVLADRCITLVLEKSNKKEITKLMENYEYDEDIQKLKRTFSVCSVVYDASKVYTLYNKYIINNLNNHTLHTFNTLVTQHTQHTLNDINDIEEIEQEKIIHFITKLKESSLTGRDLELFFPLLFISLLTNKFDELLAIAEKITQEKKQEEIVENRDTILLEFVAKDLEETNEFISIREIVSQLKEKCDDAEWITSEWVGRALKRLNLVIEKRRVARGKEVRINFAKAREKLKIFEPVVEDTQKSAEPININIQQNIQNIFNFKHYIYYKALKPINIMILYNNKAKPFKVEPGKTFMFCELGDNCFEIIKILQEEGYIEPVKTESEC
ncbi:MAG: hypothetical protein QXO00_04960 [Candidatus Bathyarchaeia archaeon]